jgi:hypothetical protein
MRRSVRYWWVVTLGVAACGGRATSYGEEPEGAASAGGMGSASTTSGAPTMSGAGSRTVGSGGNDMVDPQPSEGGEASVPSAGTPECPGLPTQCWSTNDVVYVDGAELRYPGAGSCGQCASECAECDSGCKLTVQVTPLCTGNRVKLAACSTPDHRGACLNTVARDPYYVDALGKRWSVVTLVAVDPTQFSQVGSRMAALSLTVTDGVARRVVSVALLACNTEAFHTLPC